MRTWNFCYRIRLSNNEEVLDLPQVIFRVPFRCTPEYCSISTTRGEVARRSLPHSKKIGRIGLVTEKWCTHKVVVKSREGLPRINITELHER